MTGPKVDIIATSELTPELTARWAELRAMNPALYSPYFHPDYTAMIGKLRDDVRIAVISENTDILAFFPFQGSGGFVRPVGAPMTDYHGFIEAPGAALDHIAILDAAGIGAWHYWALVSDSDDLHAHHQKTELGCMLNISQGAESWRDARDKSYRRHLKSTRRRIRKADDEVGQRRFEFNSMDQDVFDTLIKWKRGKFAETGKYDVLSAGWTLEMLERLWAQHGKLRCAMHAMYFGDRLAAVDLGLTDGQTFHSWMVAYDSDLHTYAPGIQLLEALIDAAVDLGYVRIDLGVGLDGYKKHYGTEPVTTGSGFIAVKGPAAALSQIYGAAERFGEKTLKDAPGKLRRRYSQIAACDETFSGRAKAMIDAVKSAAGAQ